MPKTRYGVSPWFSDFPRSRRPDFPRLRGDFTADVVIIGGGLTGCAAALACATAGLKPILVEQDRIGAGTTARGAGMLLPDPVSSFKELTAARGLRVSRRAFERWRAGARDAAALLRRLNIKCALEPLDLLIAAGRDDEKLLRREFDARTDAGLDLTWLTQKQVKKQTNLDSSAGVRMRDAFSFDPYAASVGLATLAARRKARLFERSVVKKVRAGRKDAEIVLDGGTIRAATVVVATGSATPLFAQLQRHFTRRESYLALTQPLPATMRRQLPDPSLAIRDTRTPPRRFRWTPDDRLLLIGGDQDEQPVRTKAPVLVQRTGDLMYGLLTMYPVISGLQPAFGWDATYGETADGMPYIGAHRNYPRHLFALGATADSSTGSFVAARLLLRAIQGAAEKGDEVFGWTR